MNEELVINLENGHEVQERKIICQLFHYYSSLSNELDNSLLIIGNIIVERSMCMNWLAIFASIPILWIMVELMFVKKNNSTLKSSVHTLIITIILAVSVWKMSISHVIIASFEGMVMSIWPISSVIVAAVFLYNICNYSGNIQYIRDTLSSVSTDKRVLVLLVAWGFGGFIEGIAGFGTSIAIVASMLLTLGFSPVYSALIALAANPISSVFGSLGVQMPTLSRVTGLSVSDLAIYSTYVVVPLVLLTPFVLVYITGKEYNIRPIIKEIWIFITISALSFAVSMYLVVKYVNEDLTGVAGAICSIVVMLIMTWISSGKKSSSIKNIGGEKITKQLIAWAPFILCIIFLTVTSKLFLPVNELLSHAKITIPISVGEKSSDYVINLFTTSTLWIFLSAFLGGKLQGISMKQSLKILYSTFIQMWRTIVTLILLLSISRIMTYSGMIKEIAVSLVQLTGMAYIIVVPFLGSIGGFITGSATSANVLLGNLQVVAAGELGRSPSWFMAFSIVGGTIGKMISPQNIAIGLSAVEISGQESELFKRIIVWYIVYLFVLVGMSIILYNI